MARSKIYLAARYSRIGELLKYRDDLQKLDFEVTSRWLNGDQDADDEQQFGEGEDILVEAVRDNPEILNTKRRFAYNDLEDIRVADCVVAFTEKPRHGPARGGRHFEAGYAAGKDKRVIVVGPMENIFYAIHEVSLVETWFAALELLQKWYPKTPTHEEIAK